MSLRYLSTIVLASLTWAFFAAGTVVAQQTATLTGSVEDSEGNPLPGANVVLAGCCTLEFECSLGQFIGGNHHI